MWISAAINTNLNRGGLSASIAKKNMIKVLEFWVNDSLYIGRVKFKADFDDTDFTIIKMTEMSDKNYTH